jgi:hypothetical protein
MITRVSAEPTPPRMDPKKSRPDRNAVAWLPQKGRRETLPASGLRARISVQSQRMSVYRAVLLVAAPNTPSESAVTA